MGGSILNARFMVWMDQIRLPVVGGVEIRNEWEWHSTVLILGSDWPIRSGSSLIAKPRDRSDCPPN